MVTGVQDGQDGHADAPAAPGEAGDETPAGIGAGMAGELEAPGAGVAGELAAPGAGMTGTGTLGEPVEPACPGTGTTGEDGDEVAKTGGPTKYVEDAAASLGLGLGEVGTGITLEVVEARQSLTLGAQLVRVTATVVEVVASATEAGAGGAVTCSWTWPSESSLAKPAMTAEPAVKAVRANE